MPNIFVIMELADKIDCFDEYYICLVELEYRRKKETSPMMVPIWDTLIHQYTEKMNNAAER